MRRKAETKAVIFDIGGVVTNWNNGIVYSRLQRMTGRSRDFIEKTYISNLRPLETGLITKKEFMRRLAVSLGSRDIATTKWFDNYAKKQGINKGVVAIIKQLARKGYKVAAITNTSRSYYRYNRSRGIYSHFGRTFVSCYLGMWKPEKRFFSHAIRALRVKPEECVFIDDYRPNVAGARRAGMKAIVFRNASYLRKELRKKGVRI